VLNLDNRTLLMDKETDAMSTLKKDRTTAREIANHIPYMPVNDISEVVSVLLDDHKHIRHALKSLELGVTQHIRYSKKDYSSWITLLEKMLEDHIRREKEALYPVLQKLLKEGMKSYHIENEHQDIEKTFQILKKTLNQNGRLDYQSLKVYATHLIDSVREHMDLEEQIIYPKIGQKMVL
jgi:hemerythrin-like domain-containing protein